MTVTFNLSSTGLTTVDFTDATFDFIFADVDYTPVVATPTGDGSIPPYVTDTLPVILRGTSHDDLALSMQELAALQKRAAEYWVDQQQATPVWLNCKLYSETGARRALVKAIGYEFRPDIQGMYRDCAGVQDYLVGTVLVERHAYWERPTARIFPNKTPGAAAAVTYDYTDYGPQLLLNNSFETAGAGGVDIWADWTEGAGDGALANEVVIVHDGADACKTTAGASDNTFVYQALAVVPNQVYNLYFWTRGDGTNDGKYGIYDVTNGAWILDPTLTAVTAAAYAPVSYNFTTPSGCVSANIYFWCPDANGGVAYFDLAYVRLEVHDIVGDVPARIDGLAIRGTGPLTRLWMGIRSATLHGATGVTAFIPVWECEDATLVVDNAIAADGGGTEPNTASPGGGVGDFVNVNPEAAGAVIDWDVGVYEPVLAWTLTDVGYTTFSDAAGRFLWLLRTKVESGEWRLRLVSGYGSYLNAQSYGEPVSVTNNAWDYKEMGVSTVPTRNRQAISTAILADGLDGLAYIVLEAQRISGVGDMRVDCLCPVPTDEGFLKIIRGYAYTTMDTWIAEGPKGSTQVVYTHDSAPDHIERNEPHEFEYFRLPPGDGRIICVYAEAAASVFTDAVEFADPGVGTSFYTERWTAMRGAE